MNYNAMSDTEFMHYLDIYNDDPIVRRLIGVLERTRGALVDDLMDAGMDDQDWTFGTGWSKQSPGQYIRQLRHELDQAESDLRLAQRELADLEDERDRLKTRSIMQFVEEVQQEKRAATHKILAAQEETKRIAQENTKLKEQINMWGRLNHVN